jgi:hypothetical protein
MKEALSSTETSVLTRTTRRNIPEDTILHSHRRGNLKSYIDSQWLDFHAEFQGCFLSLQKLLDWNITRTMGEQTNKHSFDQDMMILQFLLLSQVGPTSELTGHKHKQVINL